VGERQLPSPAHDHPDHRRGVAVAAGPSLVPPERLERWLDRFGSEHGGVTVEASAEGLLLRGSDGTCARVEAPFPPMAVDPSAAWNGLLAHVDVPRVVGVLLVRKGGYAAGVFDGARLTSSKVGSRLVQGRSAAGGWSQHRFARRREGQAREAYAAAAENAARVIVPQLARLDAVVTGGDRPALAAVLEDTRLARLLPLVVGQVLDVVDPRLVVLQDTPKRFRAARISVSACD
jgi:hypothetical protein